MPDVLVALDMFPAIAHTPEGRRYDRSRVIVADGVLSVWVAGGSPQLKRL